MHAASPSKSIASQYNTPPELSQSSSPPATHFFDVDPNTSINNDDLTIIPGTTTFVTSATMAASLPLGLSNADDEMLYQFANDDDLIQLDRDSNMLMSKFDEDFDNVGMFANNNDDVFFGSN